MSMFYCGDCNHYMDSDYFGYYDHEGSELCESCFDARGEDNDTPEDAYGLEYLMSCLANDYSDICDEVGQLEAHRLVSALIKKVDEMRWRSFYRNQQLTIAFQEFHSGQFYG